MAQFSHLLGAYWTNRHCYVMRRIEPCASVKKVRNCLGAADCSEVCEGEASSFLSQILMISDCSQHFHEWPR
jgi:hypothetical protein